MTKGGGLLAPDGKQIAVFPPEVMLITQNAGGEPTHECVFSTDNASNNTNKRTIYAPCDMVLVNKVSDWEQGNSCFFQTVDEVYTARYGLSHFSMTLVHANDISFLTQGKVYKQGEKIYTEGDSGFSMGIHVHIDVSLGHESYYIQRPCGRWEMPNAVYIDNIFFNNLTEIVRDNAVGVSVGWRLYEWLEYEGGTTPNPDPDPESDDDDEILTAMLVRCIPNFF